MGRLVGWFRGLLVVREDTSGLDWVDEHSSDDMMVERVMLPCKGCRRGVLLMVDVRCIHCGY